MADGKIPVSIPIEKAQKFRILVHEDTTFSIGGNSTTAHITGIEVVYYGSRKVIFGTILGGDHSLLGKPLFLRDMGNGLYGFDLT